MGESAEDATACGRRDRLGGRAAAGGQNEEGGRKPDADSEGRCAGSQPDHRCIMPPGAGPFVTTR